MTTNKIYSTLPVVILVALILGGCAATPQVRQEPEKQVFTPPPPPPKPDNGSIYQAGYSTALFEDVRARYVGDILTIILNEETRASKSASTSTSKDNAVDVENPTLFGLPLTLNSLTKGKLDNLEQRLSAQKSFEGEGQSDQSNQLRGTIQAMVVEVLPNRILRVEGEKVIAINQGDETVRISGLVRLQDISTDNTVPSTQVANAVITYGGSGIVADSNDMGWLGKFFNSKWFPF